MKLKTVLVLVGGALQFVGLSFLIVELGTVSALEQGTQPWWSRQKRDPMDQFVNGIRSLWRRLTALGVSVRSRFRPHAVPIELNAKGRMSATANLAADGAITPPEPGRDRPDAEWIEWLRLRVDLLQTALGETHATQRRDRSELRTEVNQAREHFEARFAETEKAETHRRAARGNSATRQGLGTVLVLLGVIVTTIGTV